MPIRIGAVSYLNTKPLVYGLDSEPHTIELSYDLPSRLADQLAAGELDVALIPSIEALEDPGYRVVSDACIACRGAVWSVKFASRVPIDRIQSVALDEGSRTSVALTKIMLAQYGLQPQFFSLPVDNDWTRSKADAVLLIGDRAMFVDRDQAVQAAGFSEIIDMGKWWRDWTEQPFVFAMWTAKSGLNDEELNVLAELFSKSRDAGLANLDEIAAENYSQYGLTEAQCLSYLRDNLHFVLSENEKIALNRFYDEAARLSLVPENQKINFHDIQAVN